VALILGRAHHGVCPGACSPFTRIGLRTGIAIVTDRPREQRARSVYCATGGDRTSIAIARIAGRVATETIYTEARPTFNGARA
jgi:prolyl-tRNA editing enzyme YbaK/EbsC (Cys-tRNA(Pro) deacylase)